jgi:predicted transcriptional regulator
MVEKLKTNIFHSHFSKVSQKENILQLRDKLKAQFMNLSDVYTAVFGSEAHVSQLAQILYQHSDVSLESAELVQVISSSQLEPSVHAEMKILAYLHQRTHSRLLATSASKKEPR